MYSKIILGTAQFSAGYAGNQINEADANHILDAALKKGVRYVDTALAYGKSETIIGHFNKLHFKRPFQVISKLPISRAKDVQNNVSFSLKQLAAEKIYGYLIHNYENFKDEPAIFQQLQHMKDEGKIEKIGFSIYYVDELEELLHNQMHFDILQVPYNILDQRFASYFPALRKLNIEIHTRSAFLQGLVFKDTKSLGLQFNKIKKKLLYLKNLSAKQDIPLANICLNFALCNPNINNIIIGVDNKNQFSENMQYSVFQKQVKNIYQELLNLREHDKNIILPINWEIDSQKIVAIIQARMGSTRLPNKVLLPIERIPALEHIIKRVSASKFINEVIVATTLNEDDLPIVKLCAKLGTKVFCGSSNDVLDRFYQASRILKATHIVRITADNFMIDPKIIDIAIEKHLAERGDYTSNVIVETYPNGQDVEIFSFPALASAWEHASLVSEREHVTPYLRKNKNIFKQISIEYPIDLSEKRWTVDQVEDYEFVKIIFKHLYKKNKFFGMGEILEFLKKNPKFEQINSYIKRNEGYVKSLKHDFKLIKTKSSKTL